MTEGEWRGGRGVTGREGLTRNMEIRLTTLPMTWRLWSQRIDVSQVVGRTKFFFPCRRRRRRQIPHLPNPINVGLIASNRLSGRGRGRPGTWRGRGPRAGIEGGRPTCPANLSRGGRRGEERQNGTITDHNCVKPLFSRRARGGGAGGRGQSPGPRCALRPPSSV